MSKSIIENHVLVSGSSRRGDLVELEKRSAEAGLPLHRTGQFGIGLLSYFMIASRVIITTKRNNLCDDTEPNGWEFETAGIGSFGELRKQNVKKQGTVVSLELKDGIANEPMSFYQQLIAYLRTTLKFIPCSFQVSSNLEKDVTRLEPGWVYSNEDLAKQVLAGLPGSTAWQTKNPAMIPKRRIRENEIKKAYWLSIHKEVRDRLRMHTVSGELPGKLGNYRVHIPTFAIGNGVSLAFLRSTEEGRGWYFFHSRRDRIPQLERNEY
jgi:HSP90 family molecular chaperone